MGEFIIAVSGLIFGLVCWRINAKSAKKLETYLREQIPKEFFFKQMKIALSIHRKLFQSCIDVDPEVHLYKKAGENPYHRYLVIQLKQGDHFWVGNTNDDGWKWRMQQLDQWERTGDGLSENARKALYVESFLGIGHAIPLTKEEITALYDAREYCSSAYFNFPDETNDYIFEIRFPVYLLYPKYSASAFNSVRGKMRRHQHYLRHVQEVEKMAPRIVRQLLMADFPEYTPGKPFPFKIKGNPIRSTEHRFIYCYKCLQCHRIPRGVGKVRITCRKCGNIWED